MHVLDLFFPPFCQSCGRFGSWICTHCWRSMIWLDPDANRPPSLFPTLKRVWACVEYDRISGKLIQGLKYSRLRVLAGPLGESMARHLSPTLQQWNIQAFIPVPLHPRRYNQRGFNQAGLIAEAISRQLHIPVERSLLTRARWHGTQATQDKTGRKAIQTMFRCRKKTDLQRVCLVDDVYTTGATLSACARALNHAGVTTVVAVTFARA